MYCCRFKLVIPPRFGHVYPYSGFQVGKNNNFIHTILILYFPDKETMECLQYFKLHNIFNHINQFDSSRLPVVAQCLARSLYTFNFQDTFVTQVTYCYPILSVSGRRATCGNICTFQYFHSTNLDQFFKGNIICEKHDPGDIQQTN